LTILVLLNLARKDGCSQEYTLREKRVERSFGAHTGHNTAGNVRSLVANHITEFKILLSDLLRNGEIKRQPTGNQGSEKIQVMEKKWKRGWLLPRRDA